MVLDDLGRRVELGPGGGARFVSSIEGTFQVVVGRGGEFPETRPLGSPGWWWFPKVVPEWFQPEPPAGGGGWAPAPSVGHRLRASQRPLAVLRAAGRYVRTGGTPARATAPRRTKKRARLLSRARGWLVVTLSLSAHGHHHILAVHVVVCIDGPHEHM